MENNDLRTIAKKRLKAQHEFRRFLGVWGAVSLLLLGIWATTSVTAGHPLYFWPVWPIAGMAVAALFKGLDAFGSGRRAITDADIDAEVARMSGSGA